VTPAAPLGGLILFFAFLGWVGSWDFGDYDREEIESLRFDNPKSKSSRKETGYAVYRIYGSNSLFMGSYLSQNSAISNAKGVLNRSSIGSAVVVMDKSTGATIWSDNK
jgi:hypothetical protein